MKNLVDNRTVKILNLSDNNLDDLFAFHFKKILESNENLEVLRRLIQGTISTLESIQKLRRSPHIGRSYSQGMGQGLGPQLEQTWIWIQCIPMHFNNRM